MLSDCLSNDFVLIYVGGGKLCLQPLVDELHVLIFLALLHLYFHMQIIHCAYSAFFPSTQGKCDLNNLPFSSLLSNSSF